MNEIIELNNILISITRKAIKHSYLSVHPPDGRVTLVTSHLTDFAIARTYAISKLTWIQQQREKLQTQARELPRQFISRESHYLWGKRYLLSVVYKQAKPHVTQTHDQIILQVRPGSDMKKCAELLHTWHKSLLHTVIPALIQQWEPRLNVKVSTYFLQRMKTRWGSCHHQAGHIRLNTELVKKPKDLLEYVIVHEMIHLIVPNHGKQFKKILQTHYPRWQEARAELNALPSPVYIVCNENMRF
jgi:predicted metal-dependent hydrolase